MSGFEWPLVIEHGDIKLRPIQVTDRKAWTEVRLRNHDWLQPWEATNPDDGSSRNVNFHQYARRLRREARAQAGLPMVIEFQGQFAGQVTLGNVVWGSLRQGYIGYWIDSKFAGRGIMPTAVAMLVDYALIVGHLHRIEINIRPENLASIRVVEKLGIPTEGFRPRYLHIAGDWRDHQVFVMTREQLPSGGLLASRPTKH